MEEAVCEYPALLNYALILRDLTYRLTCNLYMSGLLILCPTFYSALS